MTVAAVLAVDGGNSKTDVALVGEDGTLLGYARGPGSNHQVVGPDTALRVLTDCVAAAAEEAGITGRAVAQLGAFYLAGADYAAERDMLLNRVSDRGWVRDLNLDNDAFALLRAGTQAPNRIGVVCGAGINCVGQSAAGGRFQFPAVGMISGDWGGGAALGLEALFLAVRAEDGRGEETLLRVAVREHFRAASVAEVTEALHFGQLPMARLHELAPVLLRAAAAGDRLAWAVVDRLAQEVFLMVHVAIDRLRLRNESTDVVLGGGVLAARHPQLLDEVSRRISRRVPGARVQVVDSPPVLGAALLGLDAFGAAPSAEPRIRDWLLRRIDGSVVTPNLRRSGASAAHRPPAL
ncbi:MAG TPA: BadF/BadG/BcrA/BcrD ATPase family protein [Propionibacteriaceae bacterium]|nr:BadF/BadG/BcrA/BcrD ATPase family protein [Propionibacteriaceae bacterium]